MRIVTRDFVPERGFRNEGKEDEFAYVERTSWWQATQWADSAAPEAEAILVAMAQKRICDASVEYV